MSVSGMDPTGGPWRRFGSGGGLRRPYDHLERIALVIVFLLVPLAPVIGVNVGKAWLAHGSVAEAQRSVRLHEVVATLTADAPSYPGGTAEAVWTAPDGSQHAGRILAAANTPAGREVALWIDSTGLPTGPPVTEERLRLRATASGVAAGLGWLVLVLGMFALVRRRLDQLRMRQWELGWLAVEPEWRRRVLGG